jgi:hypothetical protein
LPFLHRISSKSKHFYRNKQAPIQQKALFTGAYKKGLVMWVEVVILAVFLSLLMELTKPKFKIQLKQCH